MGKVVSGILEPLQGKRSMLLDHANLFHFCIAIFLHYPSYRKSFSVWQSSQLLDALHPLVVRMNWFSWPGRSAEGWNLQSSTQCLQTTEVKLQCLAIEDTYPIFLLPVISEEHWVCPNWGHCVPHVLIAMSIQQFQCVWAVRERCLCSLDSAFEKNEKYKTVGIPLLPVTLHPRRAQ